MFAVQIACRKKGGPRKEIFTLIGCGVQFVHKIIEGKKAILRGKVHEILSQHKMVVRGFEL